MAVARPVPSSAVDDDARSAAGCRWPSRSATGMPVRKRASAGSVSTPMTESCGPVMPTSVR